MATKREMLKLSKNQNTQKQIIVGEIEYTFQHPGVRAGVQLRDRSKDFNGNLVEEKYYEELMKHVVVSPKVTWETMEEIGSKEFTELMQEASKFLMG